MTSTADSPTPRSPAVRVAQDELAKFFAVAASLDHMPWMFSRFIGEAWRRLSQTPGYVGFCLRTAGAPVKYERASHGTVTWLDAYHERFGMLPAIWFADEWGQVDIAAYARYVDARTVDASGAGSAASEECPDGVAPPDQPARPDGRAHAARPLTQHRQSASLAHVGFRKALGGRTPYGCPESPARPGADT